MFLKEQIPLSPGVCYSRTVVVEFTFASQSEDQRLLPIGDMERGKRGMHAGCVCEAGPDPLSEPASGSLESVHDLLRAITDWTSVLTLIRKSGM